MNKIKIPVLDLLKKKGRITRKENIIANIIWRA